MAKKVKENKGRGYLLWAKDTSFFKIGFTKGCVDQRTIQIQTSSPLVLLIQGERQGTRRDEAGLHSKLSEYRVSGEWFSLPETVLWPLLAFFGRSIPREAACQS